MSPKYLLPLSISAVLVTMSCSREFLRPGGGAAPGKKQAIVTLNFDDGFESVYRNAVPMLREARIPATFYVITSTYKKNDPEYMKAGEIRDLASLGNEIGVHTRTHPHLTTLRREEAIGEIRGARDDLRSLGIQPKTFAYPYGEYDSQVVDEVKESGFVGARCTAPAYNDGLTNPFLLNRYEVYSTTTFDQVKKEIDKAIANGLWLILLFHRVEDSNEYYNVRPELLREIVNYLVSVNVRTVTTAQGLRITGIAR